MTATNITSAGPDAAPGAGGPDGAGAVDAAITALRADGVDVTEEPAEEG